MLKAYTDLNEIVTLKNAHQKDGRNLLPEDLSIIKNGAIVFDENKILWVGENDRFPEQYRNIAQSLKGHVLTPELVDSHTHLVFAGNRSQEYAERLNGKSYEEIAKDGGGILFTMKETNQATENELFHLACERIERIYSYGVGTIEIKSGYGLNFEKELELSHLIYRLKKHFAPRIQIFNTFLAAHDVPKSFLSSSQYLDDVVLPLLKTIAPLKIIDAVDIFHEKNYFTDSDTKKLFSEAKSLGIFCKIHADELNDNAGAKIAADYSALSADHLLKISQEGILALASSPTVATLLPGTAFFLGKPLAPARALLNAGCKVAIASDYNPGSCHCDNVLMVASISAAQLKLNQTELWAGITLNAASALNLKNQGAIGPGMKPRFSLFKTESLSQITYNWGRNLSVSLP
ncbi:MAG: imidazolonepropionase [Bacteriovoracaceae bacterium]